MSENKKKSIPEEELKEVNGGKSVGESFWATAQTAVRLSQKKNAFSLFNKENRDRLKKLFGK